MGRGRGAEGKGGRGQHQYGSKYSQHDILCKLTRPRTHLLEQLREKLTEQLMILLLQLWLAWVEAACWLPASQDKLCGSEACASQAYSMDHRLAHHRVALVDYRAPTLSYSLGRSTGFRAQPFV